MIHEVSGDLLLSKAHAIAHGIAPHDHFSQGLALALRNNWPAMYKDFRHFCHQQNPQAGEIWTWGGADGTRIVSLFTQAPALTQQTHPGKATLEALNHCLRGLHNEVEREGFKSLALPKLATGVGGLDWADVKPLIQQHLGSLSIPIFLYTTYHPGQAAKETSV